MTSKIAVSNLVVFLVVGIAGPSSAQEAQPAPAVGVPSPRPAGLAPGYAPPPGAPIGGSNPRPAYVPVEPLGEARYRSPGLAVALSLQPLPIDFGNLYAENLSWGVAYTAIEVSVMAPMMWIAGQHMGQGSVDVRGWSGAERDTMIGLALAYVAVKLVASLHAGYSARAFNDGYEPRGMAFRRVRD